MCELASKSQLEGIRDAYADGDEYGDVDTRYGQKDLGVLLGGNGPGEDETRRNLTGKRNVQYDNPGPSGTGFSKEGWLRTAVELTTLPGTPKVDLFVTHLQPVQKDGIQYGAKDAKQRAKLSQMQNFARAVEERIEEKPHRPTIVMGDFNIHSRGGGYDGVGDAEYLSNLLQQMQALGMEDVWLTFGGPGGDSGCNRQPDRTCHPFEPDGGSYGGYYRGNRLDYVFVEKPKPTHDVRIDVSRVRTVEWPDSRWEDGLSDHTGVAFEMLTSPAP